MLFWISLLENGYKVKKIHPSAIFGNIPAYIVSKVISLPSYHVSVLDDWSRVWEHSSPPTTPTSSHCIAALVKMLLSNWGRYVFWASLPRGGHGPGWPVRTTWEHYTARVSSATSICFSNFFPVFNYAHVIQNLTQHQNHLKVKQWSPCERLFKRNTTNVQRRSTAQ